VLASMNFSAIRPFLGSRDARLAWTFLAGTAPSGSSINSSSQGLVSALRRVSSIKMPGSRGYRVQQRFLVRTNRHGDCIVGLASPPRSLHHEAVHIEHRRGARQLPSLLAVGVPMLGRLSFCPFLWVIGRFRWVVRRCLLICWLSFSAVIFVWVGAVGGVVVA